MPRPPRQDSKLPATALQLLSQWSGVVGITRLHPCCCSLPATWCPSLPQHTTFFPSGAHVLAKRAGGRQFCQGSRNGVQNGCQAGLTSESAMRLFKSQLRGSDQPTEIDEGHMMHASFVLCDAVIVPMLSAPREAVAGHSQFNFVSARSKRSWARLRTKPAPICTAPRKVRGITSM